MSEVAATSKLIGVFLLLGGVVFRRLIWNTDSLNLPVMRRISWMMISGATILVFVAVMQVLLSGAQVSLTNILPVLLAVAFLSAETRKSPMLANLAVIIALMIVVSLAGESHAGAETGVLAIASNLLHWIAAVAWGGSAIYLSSLPWSEQDDASIGIVRHRYAGLAIAALGLFALSGGLLAFIHVHNSDAMTTTDYGRFVIFKSSIVAVLIVTVSVNLLARRSPPRRFRAMLILESILLAGLLIATANLETRGPPGTPPFNNPQSWQMTAGEMPLTLSLQPVAGSSTRARIEISATNPDYRFPEGALAFFDIYSKDRQAGGYDIEAVTIGPSGFLGEAVLAIPGEWQFDLRLSLPNGEAISGESVLVLAALPLKEDLKPYLSYSAIAYSLPGLITFVVGMLLLLSAAWLVRQSWQGQARPWLMPVSMANMVLGAYLALSVTFVKTYPTTFSTNPEPYTVENIQLGDAVYRAHCAECHGIAGKGDGPWAIEERGSIPDLTAAHMDVHTDGEVFWWLTNGIPSLDKPPMSEELSESQRWIAINYIRSLRHGTPPQ